MTDGRLILRIKDAPFHDPIFARFASDGTLKMLAFLLLYWTSRHHQRCRDRRARELSPSATDVPLAEEFRSATERSQLLVTTHSPYFLDALAARGGARAVSQRARPYAGAAYTLISIASRNSWSMGRLLGDLWTEGQFSVGDPLNCRHGETRRLGLMPLRTSRCWRGRLHGDGAPDSWCQDDRQRTVDSRDSGAREPFGRCRDGSNLRRMLRPGWLTLVVDRSGQRRLPTT